MTKLIGLTGGIATGKSAVSSYLKENQVPIIDADLITHQVEQKGEDGFDAIIDQFGKRILTKDGQLDRKRLGKLVFNRSAELKKLVRTIDPFIRSEITKQFEQRAGLI